MEKSISLFYKSGTSDKVYFLQLVPDGNEYRVDFQYGRRGSALKGGTKTPEPVSESQATKIYDKIVKEKLGEGYTEGAAGTGVVMPVASKKTIGELGILPQLLNFVPDPETFINDDSYLAQEKMDGDRRMLSSDVDFNDIIGLNRKGQKVLLPTPVVKSVARNYTIDGEIIGDKLFIWDILSLDGDDARSLKCIERVALLNSDMKFGDSIIIVRTAFTREEKQALYEELIARNAEGIVFKKKNSVYTPGRPASGGNQVKYKFYKTGTFIVKDFTVGKRSVGVELIDEDGVTRVSVGRVTIPPNKDVPAVGDLIEVRYLYAFKGGSIFQPVYLGQRNDLDIDDAHTGQLIYKADDEE